MSDPSDFDYIESEQKTVETNFVPMEITEEYAEAVIKQMIYIDLNISAAIDKKMMLFEYILLDQNLPGVNDTMLKVDIANILLYNGYQVLQANNDKFLISFIEMSGPEFKHNFIDVSTQILMDCDRANEFMVRYSNKFQVSSFTSAIDAYKQVLSPSQ